MKNLKNILVLTGACGVGKSTIGKLWAQSKKGVCIECDRFRNWIHDEHPISSGYFLEVEPMTARLAWQACREYLNNGFSVAIDNVWTPKGIQFLKNNMEQARLHATFVYLTCSLEENKQHDLLRPSKHQMKERVAIVHSELEAYSWPNFVHKLDTSGQLSTETLSKILSLENNDE